MPMASKTSFPPKAGGAHACIYHEKGLPPSSSLVMMSHITLGQNITLKCGSQMNVNVVSCFSPLMGCEQAARSTASHSRLLCGFDIG